MILITKDLEYKKMSYLKTQKDVGFDRFLSVGVIRMVTLTLTLTLTPHLTPTTPPLLHPYTPLRYNKIVH